MPDDFTLILDNTTIVHPFLWPHAFEFWSKLCTVVIIPISQRVGLYTTSMHVYWQAIMTSFGEDLLGSYGFSLILYAFISPNPRLLLLTKFVTAYARNRASLLYLSGKRNSRGGFSIQDSFLLVGRRK